jgi:hypothetical protein
MNKLQVRSPVASAGGSGQNRRGVARLDSAGYEKRPMMPPYFTKSALWDARADRAAVLYRRGRCHAALAEFAAAHDYLDAHLALGSSPCQQEINDLLASCRPGSAPAADACAGPLKSRAALRPVRELGQHDGCTERHGNVWAASA